MKSSFLRHIVKEDDAQFLYDAFTALNQTYHLPIEKYLANCNQVLLDQVDTSLSKGMVTCIPLRVMESYLQVGHVPDLTQEQEVQRKNELLKQFKPKVRFNEDSNSLDRSLSIFFKPKLSKPPTNFPGWEQPSTKPRSSNREIWLSNFELKDLMIRYIPLKPGAYYAGVIYLSCFEKISSKSGLREAFAASAIKRILKEYVGKYKYVYAHIVLFSHWSAIVLDVTNNNVLYFCSCGHNIDFFPKSDLLFYNASSGIMKQEKQSTYQDHMSTIKYEFLHMVQSILNERTSIYLNITQNQLYNGECGLFSSIFLILHIMNDIVMKTDIMKLYQSQVFMGDKTMSFYREILFWNNHQSKMQQTTQIVPATILKECRDRLMKNSKALDHLNDTMLNRVKSIHKVLNVLSQGCDQHIGSQHQ